MTTLPSIKPAANRLGFTLEKDIAVTGHEVRNILSGHSVFLTDQHKIKPPLLDDNFESPYATAIISYCYRLCTGS